MGIEIVDRVQRQMVISLDGLSDDDSERLREVVESELRRLTLGNEDLEVGGWTKVTLDEAFLRLHRDGASAQVKVIRHALANNGYITRTKVYRVAGWDEDERSLRGFTRATNRIVREMKDEGLLPEDALPLLAASYQDGVRADGFMVDVRLAQL